MTEEQKLLLKLEAQNNTKRPLDELGRSLDGIKSKVLALVGLTAIAQFFRKVIDDTRRWAGELDLLQDTLGVSAEEAAHLNALARITGATADDVARGFTVFATKLRDAASAAPGTANTIRDLGIQFQNADGTARPFMDTLDEARKKVGALRDDTLKAAIAQELFGRGNRTLHDLLAMSDQEFDKIGSRTKNLIRIMGGDGVVAMERIERSQRSLSLGLMGLRVAIGVPLFQAFDGLVNRVADLAFEWMPRVEAATRAVITVFQILWGFVSSVAHLFGSLIMRIAEATGLLRLFAGVGKAVQEVLRNFLGLMKEVTARVNAFRKELDEKGLVGALRLLPEPLQQVAAGFVLLKDAAKDALAGDFTGAAQKANEGMGSIKEGVGGLVESFRGLSLQQQIGAMATAIIGAGALIRGAVLTWTIAEWLAGPLLRIAPMLVAAVGGWPVVIAVGLAALALTVATHFGSITTFIQEWGPRVWSFIREHFWTGMVGVAALIGAWPLATLLLAALNLDKITAFVNEWAPRFAEWLGRSIPEWVQGAGRLFRAFTDWIGNHGLPGAIRLVEENVPKFGKWLTDSIPEWLKNAGELMGGLLRWVIADLVPSLVSTMWNDVAPALWRWVTEILPTVLIKLALWANAVFLWVTTQFAPSVAIAMFQAGTSVVGGLIRGLGDLGKKLLDTISEAFRNLRIDVGPFHLSADGFKIDAPQLPSIQMPSFGGNPGQSHANPSGTVRGTDASGRTGVFGVDGSFIPDLAEGGLVRATPGGTIARIGEGGEDEFVIPRSRMGGGRGDVHVTVNVAGSVITERNLAATVKRALVEDLKLTKQFST